MWLRLIYIRNYWFISHKYRYIYVYLPLFVTSECPWNLRESVETVVPYEAHQTLFRFLIFIYARQSYFFWYQPLSHQLTLKFLVPKSKIKKLHLHTISGGEISVFWWQIIKCWETDVICGNRIGNKRGWNLIFFI